MTSGVQPGGMQLSRQLEPSTQGRVHNIALAGPSGEVADSAAGVHKRLRDFLTWFLAASPIRRSVSVKATLLDMILLPWSFGEISTLSFCHTRKQLHHQEQLQCILQPSGQRCANQRLGRSVRPSWTVKCRAANTQILCSR